MAMLIKETTMKGNLMVKEFFIGNVVRYMMENGTKELKMGMEYGRGQVENLILGNGRIVKLRVTGCMCGKMETSMRVNGKLVSDMGMGLTSSQTVTNS